MTTCRRSWKNCARTHVRLGRARSQRSYWTSLPERKRCAGFPRRRLHPTDLEFLQPVAQLRQRFLEVIGKQRRADEVLGLPLIVDAVRFLEYLPPFFLGVIAAAEPSERQQLDALPVAQRIDRVCQFLVGRIVGT